MEKKLSLKLKYHTREPIGSIYTEKPVSVPLKHIDFKKNFIITKIILKWSHSYMFFSYQFTTNVHSSAIIYVLIFL